MVPEPLWCGKSWEPSTGVTAQYQRMLPIIQNFQGCCRSRKPQKNRPTNRIYGSSYVQIVLCLKNFKNPVSPSGRNKCKTLSQRSAILLIAEVVPEGSAAFLMALRDGNPGDTVDGWNPAPAIIYETLWKMGYFPYQMVQDFFHQQYLNSWWRLGNGMEVHLLRFSIESDDSSSNLHLDALGGMVGSWGSREGASKHKCKAPHSPLQIWTLAVKLRK